MLVRLGRQNLEWLQTAGFILCFQMESWAAAAVFLTQRPRFLLSLGSSLRQAPSSQGVFPPRGASSTTVDESGTETLDRRSSHLPREIYPEHSFRVRLES